MLRLTLPTTGSQRALCPKCQGQQCWTIQRADEPPHLVFYWECSLNKTVSTVRRIWGCKCREESVTLGDECNRAVHGGESTPVRLAPWGSLGSRLKESALWHCSASRLYRCQVKHRVISFVRRQSHGLIFRICQIPPRFKKFIISRWALDIPGRIETSTRYKDMQPQKRERVGNGDSALDQGMTMFEGSRTFQTPTPRRTCEMVGTKGISELEPILARRSERGFNPLSRSHACSLDHFARRLHQICPKFDG